MAFAKLSALLKERSADKAHLREAAQGKALHHVFQEAIPELFPAHLQEHLQASVRVLSVRSGVLLLGAADSQTTALLTLERERVKEAISRRNPEVREIRIETNRRHR